MASKWESTYKHSIHPDYRKFYIMKQIKNNPLKKEFKVKTVLKKFSMSSMIAGLIKMCILREF